MGYYARWFEQGGRSGCRGCRNKEPRTRSPRRPQLPERGQGFLWLPQRNGATEPGVEEFREELSRKEVKTTVFASVYGEGPEEFAEVAEKIAPEVDAIELNLSCPHAEKLGAAVGSDPALVEEVVRKVQGELDLPVLAKLTPNVTDIREIGRAAESGGADGLVAINTLPGMAIDVNTGRPILGNTSGGLSGGQFTRWL